MLNRRKAFYWNFLNSVAAYLRLPPFTEEIPLPAAAVDRPFSEWVTPGVWATRDVDAISHDVFMRLGDRPEAVLSMANDDREATRGVFLTTDYPVRYEDIVWPMQVQPLAFMCMLCEQRVVHYHVAILFSYFSISPLHLCNALNIQYRECSRIKLGWLNVEDYIRMQGRAMISYVINDTRAFRFEDHLRSPCMNHTLVVERVSLGYPGFFDGSTPRPVHWKRQGVMPWEVPVRDTEHVAHRDKYFSPVVGGVGRDYAGQFVVFAVPSPRNTVHAPVAAGVVVKLVRDRFTV